MNWYFRFWIAVATSPSLIICGCSSSRSEPQPLPLPPASVQDFEVTRLFVNEQDLTVSTSKGVAKKGEPLQVDLRFKVGEKVEMDQSSAIATFFFVRSEGGLRYVTQGKADLTKEGEEYAFTCKLRGARIAQKMTFQVMLPAKVILQRDFEILTQ